MVRLKKKIKLQKCGINTYLKYFYNNLSLVESSPELSRLFGQHICCIPGTARNAKVRVSAPEARNSPGLVRFTGLSLYVYLLFLLSRQDSFQANKIPNGP